MSFGEECAIGVITSGRIGWVINTPDARGSRDARENCSVGV